MPPSLLESIFGSLTTKPTTEKEDHGHGDGPSLVDDLDNDNENKHFVNETKNGCDIEKEKKTKKDEKKKAKKKNEKKMSTEKLDEDGDNENEDLVAQVEKKKKKKTKNDEKTKRMRTDDPVKVENPQNTSAGTNANALLNNLFSKKIVIPTLVLKESKKIGETNESEQSNMNDKDKSKYYKDSDEDDNDDDNNSKGNNKVPENNSGPVEERTIFVGNLPVSITRRQLRKWFRTVGEVESTRIRSVPVTSLHMKVAPDKAGKKNYLRKVCANTKQLVGMIPPTANADSKSSTNINISSERRKEFEEYEKLKVPKTSVQGYVVFVHKESVEAALEFNNKWIVPVRNATTTSSPQWELVEEDDHDDRINIDFDIDEEDKNIPSNGSRRLRVDRVDRPTQDPKRTVFVGNLPYLADEETLRQHFLQHAEYDTSNNSNVIDGIRIVRDGETYRCKGFAYVLMSEPKHVLTALQQIVNTTYMNRPLRVQPCGRHFITSHLSYKNMSNNKNKSNINNNKKKVKEHRDKLGADDDKTTRKNRLSNYEDSNSGTKRKREASTLNNDGKSTTSGPMGALRRLLEKDERMIASSNVTGKKTVRKRGDTSKSEPKKKKMDATKAAGKSRRAVAVAKSNKRMQKLEKRVNKGMGKVRKAKTSSSSF